MFCYYETSCGSYPFPSYSRNIRILNQFNSQIEEFRIHSVDVSYHPCIWTYRPTFWLMLVIGIDIPTHCSQY